MMTKFVVRGSDPPEHTVEFWLEQTGGIVHLMAKGNDGIAQEVLIISEDGVRRIALGTKNDVFRAVATDINERIVDATRSV